MYRIAFLAVVALSVGCGGGDAEGTLTYAMSGEGIPETRIIAKAASVDASLTCQTFEATTDANGAFKIEGLCGGTPYKLRTSNDQLWIPDLENVPDGGQAGIEIKAWVATDTNGVFKLVGGNLNPIKSTTDLKHETILDSEGVTVGYPARVPGKVELIGEGDHLVFLGTSTIADMTFEPLIRSGERKFDGRITMQPWSFIGVKFTDDTTYEKVTATVDDGKVVSKESGERAARYYPHDALPAGRYVVYNAKKKRGVVTIVDFGKATPKREKAPAAEPE